MLKVDLESVSEGYDQGPACFEVVLVWRRRNLLLQRRQYLRDSNSRIEPESNMTTSVVDTFILDYILLQKQGIGPTKAPILPPVHPLHSRFVEYLQHFNPPQPH
jgi:hypothetical protein